MFSTYVRFVHIVLLFFVKNCPIKVANYKIYMFYCKQKEEYMIDLINNLSFQTKVQNPQNKVQNTQKDSSSIVKANVQQSSALQKQNTNKKKSQKTEQYIFAGAAVLLLLLALLKRKALAGFFKKFFRKNDAMPPGGERGGFNNFPPEPPKPPAAASGMLKKGGDNPPEPPAAASGMSKKGGDKPPKPPKASSGMFNQGGDNPPKPPAAASDMLKNGDDNPPKPPALGALADNTPRMAEFTESVDNVSDMVQLSKLLLTQAKKSNDYYDEKKLLADILEAKKIRMILNEMPEGNQYKKKLAIYLETIEQRIKANSPHCQTAGTKNSAAQRTRTKDDIDDYLLLEQMRHDTFSHSGSNFDAHKSENFTPHSPLDDNVDELSTLPYNTSHESYSYGGGLDDYGDELADYGEDYGLLC